MTLISTVTPAVVTAVDDSNVRAALSVMLAVALIAFLVQREIGVATGGRLRRWGRVLPIVIAPMLFNFAELVLSHLVITH